MRKSRLYKRITSFGLAAAIVMASVSSGLAAEESALLEEVVEGQRTVGTLASEETIDALESERETTIFAADTGYVEVQGEETDPFGEILEDEERLEQDAIEEWGDLSSDEGILSDEQEILAASEGDETLEASASGMLAIELPDAQASLRELQLGVAFYKFDFLSGIIKYDDNTSLPFGFGVDNVNISYEDNEDEDEYFNGNIETISCPIELDTDIWVQLNFFDGEEETVLKRDQTGSYTMQASCWVDGRTIYSNKAQLTITNQNSPEVTELRVGQEESVRVTRDTPAYYAYHNTDSNIIQLRMSGSGASDLIVSMLRVSGHLYHIEENRGIGFYEGEDAEFEFQPEANTDYLIRVIIPEDAEGDTFNGTIVEDEITAAIVTWHKNYGGSDETYSESCAIGSGYFGFDPSDYWNEEAMDEGMMPCGFHIGSAYGPLIGFGGSSDWYEVTENVDLYLHWDTAVTVTWYPQGGYWFWDEAEISEHNSEIIEEIYCKGYPVCSNEHANVASPDPSKVFAGWSKTQDGSVWIEDDSSQEVTENVNLYAVFKDKNAQVHVHVWDAGAVITPATEDTAGVRLYTCPGCGLTRTESIPPVPVMLTIAKSSSGVKAKAGAKGKATITWKKFKQTKKTKAIWKKIKKIEVQYSTDKSFRTGVVKKLVGKNKTKLSVKGLKNNTTYYVRTRYTDGGGGYSKWSGIKKFKTKKK